MHRLFRGQEFTEFLLERFSQTGILVLDNQSKIINANQRVLRLLKKTTKQVTGRDFSSAVFLYDSKGAELPERKQPVWNALNKADFNQVTPFFCFYRSSSKAKPVAIAMRAIQIKQKHKITGVVVELREVSRKLEVDEMKTLFISFAAHQLKTPSSIVKGFLELMMRSGKKNFPQEQWENLHSAYEANERLIELSRTLLNITKLEGGLIEPNLTEFEPERLIRDKVSSFRVLLDIKQIKVDLDAVGLAMFLSDITFVTEIFGIIFSNAIKYSPDGETIKVAIKATKDSLMVMVTDQGQGIAPGEQKKLFEKHAKSDPFHDSHGVGLYLAQKYLALLGGTIGVRSKASGKKETSFFFSIPRPIV